MTALRKTVPRRMMVAEFLDWADREPSGRRWQLRDGVPEAMAPTTEPHGAILIEFGALIREHLMRTGSPCRVIGEPGVVPRAGAHENVRIPDLAVICRPPSRERLMDEPVLLIEILSPSNEKQTRANVWAYTTIPSVRDIVVVDSRAVRAELLHRQRDDTWPEQPARLGPDDTLELASIGLALPLRAIYRTAAVDK
ncbi:MAG: Uma2 family endonuclease [Alphaproteobacteria bacterium]|nr:Uma2 family endonuclease [Alphaproteobacteria bacterium]